MKNHEGFGLIYNTKWAPTVISEVTTPVKLLGLHISIAIYRG